MLVVLKCLAQSTFLSTISPFQSTSYGDRSFSVGAARLWNELPPGFYSIGSDAFKMELRAHSTLGTGSELSLQDKNVV